MNKLTLLLTLAISLISCTKEEQCASIDRIYVSEVTLDGVTYEYITFNYGNNGYQIVPAGEDYSEFSDLNECELKELLNE